MHGPCGGHSGAVPRGGKAYGKGGYPSNRKMPLKGLRKGGYILVTYKEKKAPGLLEEKVLYEGTIVDKRVGCVNRESYVELEDCIRLNEQGEVEAKEGTKKLFDAFIEECEVVEKVERPLSAELKARTEPAATSAGMNSMNGGMEAMMMAAMGMMPMNMGMGMMGMPMMGMMPMGMMMPMMGMPTGSLPSTAPSMNGGSGSACGSSLPSGPMTNLAGGAGGMANGFFGCGASSSPGASGATTSASASQQAPPPPPAPPARERSRSRSRGR